MKFYITLIIALILGVFAVLHWGFFGLIIFTLIYFFIVPENKK